MNKFDSERLKSDYINDAVLARKDEIVVENLYIDGKASEADYLRAVARTEEFVHFAVKQGCSYKDLPAI